MLAIGFFFQAFSLGELLGPLGGILRGFGVLLFVFPYPGARGSGAGGVAELP